MEAWRARPLDEVYPILYIDALRVKVRHGQVTNSPHTVIGVDVDGVKDVLGLWVAEGEGAKFWMHVLTQIRNRGVRDVLIVGCDGLKGLPEAIGRVAPGHPDLRRSPDPQHFRLASKRDWDARKRGVKPVYTAANETAALEAMEKVRRTGARATGLIQLRSAWEQFIPFLEFDVEIRTVLCSTNAIESLNARYRRAVKARGISPLSRQR